MRMNLFLQKKWKSYREPSTAMKDKQLKENVKLLIARTEDIQSSKNTQELYKQVLDAIQEYSGANYTEEEDGDFY